MSTEIEKAMKVLTEAILLSALLVSLSGCNVDKAKPVTVSDRTDDMRVYIVDGNELECILWVHQLSCNWDKYNELIKNTGVK